MQRKLRVFISYSTRDREKAELLHRDLKAAGAAVFQFERSATPGTEAWNELLRWIDASDVFIVLLSKGSVHSSPVRAEIEHAHHRYVNSQRPRRLIPAVIEEGAPVPRQICRFTQLPMHDYDAGLQQLIDELGLVRCSTSPGKASRQRPRSARAKSKPRRKRASRRSHTPQPPSYLDLLSSSTTEVQRRTTESIESASAYTREGHKAHLVVIGVVTCIGAICGFFVIRLVLAGLGFLESRLGLPSRYISHLTGWWGLLPWLTGVGILVAISIVAWRFASDEIVPDTFDYSVVSLKSIGVSLAMALFWIVFFSATAGRGLSILYGSLSTLVAGATLAAYVLLEEF